MKHSIEPGSFMDSPTRALPEENLLAAMVIRAYNDLFDKDPLIRRDAIIWLEGNSPLPGESGISFRAVCVALGLNQRWLWESIQDQLGEGFDSQELQSGLMEDIVRRIAPSREIAVGYGGHRNGSQTRMLLR